MLNRIFPKVNEKMFFMEKEIIVLKVYRDFQLAQVQYVCSPSKFVVDINVLTQWPNKVKSISIKLLGGCWQ